MPGRGPWGLIHSSDPLEDVQDGQQLGRGLIGALARRLMEREHADSVSGLELARTNSPKQDLIKPKRFAETYWLPLNFCHEGFWVRKTGYSWVLQALPWDVGSTPYQI